MDQHKHTNVIVLSQGLVLSQDSISYNKLLVL